MAYLVMLSILSIRTSRSMECSPSRFRSFVIVVPAYNEEEGIRETLRNLAEIDYPDHLFKVLVIADNCTDSTAEIAREEGAVAWERDNRELRGKGYALRWCFDRLLGNHVGEQKDAVVVVDADSEVTPNLLKVMNKYMDRGAEVVQGYLTVRPNSKVWTSEIIHIGFTLYNYVRPLARRRLGLPSGLRGNGMCFSLDVLRRVPWDAYSQTEDLEYGLKLLLNDVDVVFAPEAIGYNVIPANARNAESQRERWELGRLPVFKNYAGLLFRESIRRRSLKLFDTLVDLLIPPLVNMLVFSFLMAGISLLLWWTGLTGTLGYMWAWLGVVALGILHALLGLRSARVRRSTYRSLLYVPRYALWKMYIYFKILFLKGRDTEWVRTPREQSEPLS